MPIILSCCLRIFFHSDGDGFSFYGFFAPGCGTFYLTFACREGVFSQLNCFCDRKKLYLLCFFAFVTAENGLIAIYNCDNFNKFLVLIVGHVFLTKIKPV